MKFSVGDDDDSFLSLYMSSVLCHSCGESNFCDGYLRSNGSLGIPLGELDLEFAKRYSDIRGSGWQHQFSTALVGPADKWTIMRTILLIPSFPFDFLVVVVPLDLLAGNLLQRLCSETQIGTNPWISWMLLLMTAGSSS